MIEVTILQIFNISIESSLTEFFFAPYLDYSPYQIFLESIAAFFGIASVLYSRINNVLVFPTGLISTLIYVYLLWQFELLGDIIINAYYFLMSIYGWYYWTRKREEKISYPVTQSTPNDLKIVIILFLLTVVFITIVYSIFNKWDNVTSIVDTITTGIFFVGMWLMARRKIENWLFWIVGDLISIPLYFYKGLTISSLQYIIFTFLAALGYLQWKRHYLNKTAIL